MGEGKKVLWVLSGGGMPGLDIHAGMVHALFNHGITPTHLSGTSAGAAIAAMLSAGYDGFMIRQTIDRLCDSDVRRERPFWKVRVPFIDHFLDSEPILKLLCELLPEEYSAYSLPLEAQALRAYDGQACNVFREYYFRDPRQAVMASMSISGAFDEVCSCYDGHFFDGGVAANMPIPENAAEFDLVICLWGAGRQQDYLHSDSMISRLMRNVGWLMRAQMHAAISKARDAGANVIVLDPQLLTPRGTFRFDHELATRSYAYVESYLANIRDRWQNQAALDSLKNFWQPEAAHA